MVLADVAVFTILVVGVTVVWSYMGFTRAGVVDRFVFEPRRILAGKEYYRMVTSGFLHGDYVHLLFNMFSFYMFANHIELIFGWHWVAMIYFSAILGGSVLSLFLHRHHEYRALGASGGVCGIIFASIFLLPGGSVVAWPLPVPIPSSIYAVLFILGSFYGMRRQADNIGHDAHMGGAIIGLWAATALKPGIVGESPVLYGVVMGISGVLLLVSVRQRHGEGEWIRKLSWKKASDEVKFRRAAQKQRSDEETLERLLEK
ncbi:MAG: rhomboid family intramembrane serine protease, partial [Planctomycetes bacterium]|nr:rhomboid family intramembrane serine protease [Planctomycetota bacterium]